MSLTRFIIGGLVFDFPPVVHPDDTVEARTGLPDPNHTMQLLARAEQGICIYLDVDSSEECGDQTEPGQRYCDQHSEAMEDAGEETSLADWRAEIAAAETAAHPSGDHLVTLVIEARVAERPASMPVSPDSISIAGLRVMGPASMPVPTSEVHAGTPRSTTGAAAVGQASAVTDESWREQRYGLLVGNQEICVRTGASRALVHSWAKNRQNFPPPIIRLAASPIYWWPEVDAWLAAQAAISDSYRRVIQEWSPTSDQSRPATLPVLAGVADIAARTSVSRATVCNWRRRYSPPQIPPRGSSGGLDPRPVGRLRGAGRGGQPWFPASVVDLSMGSIYEWAQVQSWLAATGLPGTLAGAQ